MSNGTTDVAAGKVLPVIQVDEAQVQQHLGELVRQSVEQTLNGLLDAEADRLCHARRYERSAERPAKAAAGQKARAVLAKLEELRLGKAATILQDGYAETLSYYDFPSEHWRSLQTNNPLERILREVRRPTRVVGAFPDGQSALMLVAARLRHIAGGRWGERRYLNMDRLLAPAAVEEAALAG